MGQPSLSGSGGGWGVSGFHCGAALVDSWIGWGNLQQVPPMDVTPGPTGPLNWDGCTYTFRITSGYTVTAEQFHAEGFYRILRGTEEIVRLIFSIFLLSNKQYSTFI